MLNFACVDDICFLGCLDIFYTIVGKKKVDVKISNL